MQGGDQVQQVRRPEPGAHVCRQVGDVREGEQERALCAHVQAQALQDGGHRLRRQCVFAQVFRARRQRLSLTGLTRACQYARRRGPAACGDQHLGGGSHQRIHAKTPRRGVQVAQAFEQEALVEAVRAADRHVARHDGLVGRALAQARRHRAHRIAPSVRGSTSD